MSMNDAESENDVKPKSGMMSFILVLLVMTVVAGGAGIVTGSLLVGDNAENAAQKEQKKSTTSSKAQEPDSSSKNDKIDEVASATILDLDPIVTNLGQPSSKWVRLELSVQLKAGYEGDKDELKNRVAQDLLAFTRTLSLRHIAGATGLLHVKEDFEERAKTRSNGSIQEVFIKTLVIE